MARGGVAYLASGINSQVIGYTSYLMSIVTGGFVSLWRSKDIIYLALVHVVQFATPKLL